MTRRRHAALKTSDIARLGFTAVAVFAAAYLLLSNAAGTGEKYSEAQFTDGSPSGLQIVPASGVSETSYQTTYQTTYQTSYGPAETTYQTTYQTSYGPGETTYQTTYQTSYGPGQTSYGPGQTSYGPGQTSYSPAETSYRCWDGSSASSLLNCPPCPEGYTKVGNQCVPPNAPQFVGFTTPDGFQATGHLQVRPSLVRSGDTSKVYWNVTNVRDCTVTGTNGDRWSSTGSGTTGKVTSRIASRTDYTLFCHSLVGATPSTITETRTVNVLPSWYEPSQGN